MRAVGGVVDIPAGQTSDNVLKDTPLNQLYRPTRTTVLARCQTALAAANFDQANHVACSYQVASDQMANNVIVASNSVGESAATPQSEGKVMFGVGFNMADEVFSGETPSGQLSLQFFNRTNVAVSVAWRYEVE